MDPPYNVHHTQNSVQCKPYTKIVHHSANRGSVVVFLIASGFLQKKTDVVMKKGAAVNSLYINILWHYLSVVHTYNCRQSKGKESQCMTTGGWGLPFCKEKYSIHHSWASLNENLAAEER